MSAKQFEAVLQNRLAKIKTVLGAKAKEYSSDTDRYQNFKMYGRMACTGVVAPCAGAWIETLSRSSGPRQQLHGIAWRRYAESI